MRRSFASHLESLSLNLGQYSREKLFILTKWAGSYSYEGLFCLRHEIQILSLFLCRLPLWVSCASDLANTPFPISPQTTVIILVLLDFLSLTKLSPHLSNSLTFSLSSLDIMERNYKDGPQPPQPPHTGLSPIVTTASPQYLIVLRMLTHLLHHSEQLNPPSSVTAPTQGDPQPSHWHPLTVITIPGKVIFHTLSGFLIIQEKKEQRITLELRKKVP